ncbi:protein DDI1 homolog 2 isoform X1 [Anolis sagrei]|uniref:protein DDI1 homolog 2 isoform X1 n=1 Tax=Anolis sagrei TaxID=38937 RepID=UPI003520BC34
MLLTVFCLRRDRSELTFSLQVDADFELQNFRALCELESGIPAAQSQIVYAERPLTDNHRSLASYGLKDGDVVILQQVENAEARPPAPFPGLPRIDFSSIAVPGSSSVPPPAPPPAPLPASASHPPPPDLPSSPQGLDNPALLRDMLLANPHELSLLKERNPPLAEALLSGDLEKFTRVLVEQQQDRARREQERIRLFSADPFDLEAQAKIEEDIRQQNIEENMTIAMEEAPESFGQVVMLYINCKVNGHPVKAFVDSGAQMTIMSQACAERCNIMRLVDRRWAGIAKGVGTQKIIGRVHLAQVQIEGDFLPCSFSILEEQPMDMLLGLDMLKRHQCSIDLKKNVLVIGTTGSQTTFLPEGELPECARLAYGAGREEVRPEEIADQELAEALQKSVEDAENSDQGTTSRETPPTSDGFKRPELGPKANNPRSRILDRSASAPASIFSRGSGQAETLPPEDSLPECLETLESEELFPPPPPPFFPDAVASANAALGGKLGAEPEHVPSQTTSGPLAPSFSLQEETLSPPAEGGKERSLSSPQRKEMSAPFLLDHTERDLGHKLHSEPKMGGKPGNGGFHNAKEAASLLCAGRGDVEREGCKDSMEVDHTKTALSGDANLTMEVELSKPGSSFPLGGGGPPPEGDRMPPVSPGLEDPGASLSCALKELHQLLVVSSKQDVGLSQREALPEEHQGLPFPRHIEPFAESMESLEAREVQRMDESREKEAVLKSFAYEMESVEVKEVQRLAENCEKEAVVESFAYKMESVEVKEMPRLGENRGKEALLQSVEDDMESIEVKDVQRLDEGREKEDLLMSFEVRKVQRLDVAHEKEALLESFAYETESVEVKVVHGSEKEAPLVARESSIPLEHLRGAESSASPSRLSSPDRVLHPEVPEESRLPQDASRNLPRPSPEGTGTPFPSGGDLQRSSGAALLPPPSRPPVSGVDQIVGAGFTVQEAGEALAQADGNADLALLLLLAKNIVVPT